MLAPPPRGALDAANFEPQMTENTAESLKYDSSLTGRESRILTQTPKREFSDADAVDTALIAKVSKTQDVESYRQLVTRHINRSLGFAERMTGNRADAEDIVQEGFLAVWKGARRWQDRAKFTTWFRTILYNLTVDHLRKRPLSIADAEPNDDAHPAPDAEASLISSEAAGRVRDALQTLPDRQRAALILFYYEGLNQTEAAQVMEVSIGAFEALLQRAKTGLRETLKSDLARREAGK